MNLAIDNMAQESTPVAVMDGSTPKVDEISAGVTYYVRDDSTVVIVGHKPDLEEQLRMAGAVLVETFRRIRDAIAGRGGNTGAAVPESMNLSIDNNGDLPVRVILGDGVNDRTLQPGANFMAQCKGYVEIRELGHVPQSDDPAQQQGQTIA